MKLPPVVPKLPLAGLIWLRLVWIPVPDRVEDRLCALREVVPYPPACKPYGLEAGTESGMPTFYELINRDGLVKSRQICHPGESRGPEVVNIPGFRLSPSGV